MPTCMSSTGARQQACAAPAQAGGAAVCAGGRAGGPAAVRRGDGVVAAPAAARVPAVRAQVPGQHQLAGAHGRRAFATQPQQVCSVLPPESLLSACWDPANAGSLVRAAPDSTAPLLRVALPVHGEGAAQSVPCCMGG